MISLCLVIFVLCNSATSEKNNNSVLAFEMPGNGPGTIIVNVNGSYNNIYIWIPGYSGSNNNGSNNNGDQTTTQTPEISTQPKPIEIYSSCDEAVQKEHKSGVYRIQIPNSKLEPFDVYCVDDLASRHPWTTIQRRIDGTVDFHQNWSSYESGFGDPSGEYFVGLKVIRELTSKGNYELYIKMHDWGSQARYALYNSFSIEDENYNYMIRLGAYSGDAGDSLKPHSFQKFSTFDNDNDESPNENCAEKYKSGWWFKSCLKSNLNGQYSERNEYGIIWGTWHGMKYSMKSVLMAIRPRDLR